jgi:multidrug resistance efflux pump
MRMKKVSSTLFVNPRVMVSKIKTAWPLLVWLLALLLAVFVYFHGGQFGGMTGTVSTNFDHAVLLETARVKAVSVQVGDSVAKGDLLAQMDTSLLMAERDVLAAEAQALRGELAVVTEEMTRFEKLMAQGLVNEGEIISLRVKQKTLQATLDASEVDKEIKLLTMRIENSTLRAKADGVVSRVYYSSGDIVPGGDPILASVVTQAPSIVGFLPESNSYDIYVGIKAYVTPASRPGVVFSAKVVSLTPDVFSLPGRIQPSAARAYRGRRVIFEVDPEAVLLPGEEVQIYLKRPWTFQMLGRFFKPEVSQ